MKRNLDYFKTLLDEPETLDDEEFKRKLKQWVNFYQANRKKIDFETDEIQDRLEVMIENLKSRFQRTPEIEEKWKKVCELVDSLETNKDAALEVGKVVLAFMEEYRWHYHFTPQQIARQRKLIRSGEIVHAKVIENERKLRESKIIQEDSLRELDEGLAAYVEQTGKTPVLTALPSRKKHSGN